MLRLEIPFFDVKILGWVIMLFTFKVWTEISHTSLSFILNRLVGISEKNLNIYLSVCVSFLFLDGYLRGKTSILGRVLNHKAIDNKIRSHIYT